MFKAMGESKWIYSNHQRRHTHEVSSLAVIKDRVVSGMRRGEGGEGESRRSGEEGDVGV